MKSARRILFAMSIALLAFYLLTRGSMGPTVEQGSILAIDVSGAYVEAPEAPLLSRLLGRSHKPLASLLSDFAKAQRDDRIAAVVVRVGALQMGWAQAQEIRAAIQELSGAGRRVVALVEVESFGANLEYYVASAADEVYAAPASHAPLVGLAAEYLFLGGLWESLGLRVEVERIGRYKSAGETFGHKKMSDANREMANSLLDSINAQFVEGIARSRGQTPDLVRTAIDTAPVNSEELLALNLLDGVLYFDELLEKLGDAPLIEGSDYAQIDPASVGFAPEARFALVYGSGSVVVGEGDVSRTGAPVLASRTVSKALRDAAEDPSIAAVIFRIESPGGSPLAADEVWRAVELARGSGKPVVASFANVAASGGYYAAASADAILASPGTLTGSIGVLVLRPVLGGLLDKLNIGFESLTRGAHADLQLATRSLSEGSRERLRVEVRSLYELFVGRVASSRALDFDEVDAVAQGRVWTGAQAAERGLVDELGGLRAAVLRAKREAGIAPDTDIALVPYPAPKGLVEQLQAALQGAVVGLGDVGPAAALLRRLEPWLRAAADGAPALLLPFSLQIH